MFALINHFQNSLLLRTFSAFKLSVECGNASSGFSNGFLVQQLFNTARMLRSYMYLSFFFYLEKFSKAISFNELASSVSKEQSTQ